MSHANALLTPKGRLRLARCVVDDGWTLRRAAERFQVSVTTAARWAARYRDHGEDGMQDRSSRPVNSPQRTPVRRERRIIAIRVNRRWGPARIGFLLGIHPSTVHRVLSRFGLARLSWLDRATGRVIRRYEHQSPGDLVHVDIKKLGRIRPGRRPGFRAHDLRQGHHCHGHRCHPAAGCRGRADLRDRPGPAPPRLRLTGHRLRRVLAAGVERTECMLSDFTQCAPESAAITRSGRTDSPFCSHPPGCFQTPVRIGVAGLGLAGRVGAGRSTPRS
jgi:transposase